MNAPRGIACLKEVEYCRCGRQMIETTERRSWADRDTGEFPMERWHSCPRYLVPWWKAIFPGFGMGHESHSAENAILGRTWA